MSLWNPEVRTYSSGDAADPDVRRAPVNGMRGYTIAWWEHEAAWRRYGSRYDQSAARVAERGGFGLNELIAYLGHGPATILPDDTSGIESMRQAVRKPASASKETTNG